MEKNNYDEENNISLKNKKVYEDNLLETGERISEIINQIEKEKKLTSYSMGKNVIKTWENLDLEENKTKNNLLSKINQVLLNDIEGKYFALMSPNFKYLTLFANNSGLKKKDLAQEIYNFINEEVKEKVFGGVKDFGLRDKGHSLEIWIDDEVYLLFSYKKGVIEL